MQTTSWNNYSLSQMMLGTVQFGMPYGVANRTGQPEYQDALAIVAAALEGGVNCFDTAAAYGTSEEVLGRALHELGVAERVVVVTKVRALSAEEVADSTLVRRAIEQSVDQSRRRLKLDCLPIVLFHRESDGLYLDELQLLKDRGWLRFAGVSCDNRPGPANQFAKSGKTSALQIPGNVLDPRHQRSGVFRESAENGVAVFIRSVYLQGLLVMPAADIPANLRDVVPIRRQLETLARKAGISLAELALRYMLSQAGVTCVLTGVETVAQVHDNVALFNSGPLPADLLAAVEASVPELPESLITPWQWPTRPTPTLNAEQA